MKVTQKKSAIESDQEGQPMAWSKDATRRYSPVQNASRDRGTWLDKVIRNYPEMRTTMLLNIQTLKVLLAIG